MCFGALTGVELCDLCGRHHPESLDERCLDLTAVRAAAGLDAELRAYLESNEASFFAWLAARTG